MKEIEQEIEQLKKYSDIINESWGNEQQLGFKEMIPKVEYVLQNHAGILSGKEKKVVEHYLRFITNKETSLSNSVSDEAKTIVKYLSRV